MGEYTLDKQIKAIEIDPLDDNFKDELREIMLSFRPVSEFMDLFIRDHGFDGGDDPKEKEDFIKLKFREAGITPSPRNIKSWFDPGKNAWRPFERRTAFLICCAFRLPVEEVEDFFTRCYLGRGFDLHKKLDAVYYFALKEGLPFEKIRELETLPEAPEEDLPEETVYTDTIAGDLDRIRTCGELLDYFRMNESVFQYNNATAYRNISALWEKIAGQGGMAEKERTHLFFEEIGDDPESSMWTEPAGKTSLEGTLWQMLGLSREATEEISRKAKAERSLKAILRENPLMHTLAEASFPDRNGLKNILDGKRVSYETVRKILILLYFYKFWADLALKRRDGTYFATREDAARCVDEMNSLLLEAGYPLLYYGNPFDWIILFCIADDYPLRTFREYFRELMRAEKNARAAANP